MRTRLASLLLLIAACSSGAGKDLGLSPGEDLAVADLATDDLGVPDLAGEDLSVPDLAPPVDLGPPVGSVQVSATGSTTLVLVNATVQLSASALDFDGGVLASELFAWRSDAPAVASVDATGKVTAVGEGTALIHATAGPNGADGTITVTVTIPVNSVSVAPATLAIADGKSATLSATGHDAANAPIGGVSFTWMTSDVTHAAVDTTGQVSGVLSGAFGLGPYTITATANGHGGTAQVSIAVYHAWTFAVGMAGPNIDVTQNQYLILHNTDAATHSVVLDAGGTIVGNFGKGDSAAAHVSLAPGSYPFHCGVHGTAMTGTLVVH